MDSTFIYFIITVLIINVAPGPAMLFVLQQSHKSGMRSGVFAALGIEIGVFIYVILTAFGVSTIFNDYPQVYNGLQIIGSAYLFYIAYISWPRKKEKLDQPKVERYSNHGTLLKGVFISLTNPKIALFFLSLIPQFVLSKDSSMTFFLYGLIFNLVGICVSFSIAMMADKVNRFLIKLKWFDYIPPILFVFIAMLSIYGNL